MGVKLDPAELFLDNKNTTKNYNARVGSRSVHHHTIILNIIWYG